MNDLLRGFSGLTPEMQQHLSDVGFTDAHINAVAADLYSAMNVISSKNATVLRQLTYHELKSQDGLLEVYERVEDNSHTVEDIIRLMRETKLSSAVLSRALIISKDYDGGDVEPYVRRDRAHAESNGQEVRIKMRRNIGNAGVTGFTVKEKIGILRGAPMANVVERRTYASIDDARESDMRQHLGLSARHERDNREPVTIVPISATYFAHR